MSELPDPVILNNKVLELELAQLDDMTMTKGHEFLHALHLVQTRAKVMNEVMLRQTALADLTSSTNQVDPEHPICSR